MTDVFHACFELICFLQSMVTEFIFDIMYGESELINLQDIHV